MGNQQGTGVASIRPFLGIEGSDLWPVWGQRLCLGDMVQFKEKCLCYDVKGRLRDDELELAERLQPASPWILHPEPGEGRTRFATATRLPRLTTNYKIRMSSDFGVTAKAARTEIVKFEASGRQEWGFGLVQVDGVERNLNMVNSSELFSRLSDQLQRFSVFANTRRIPLNELFVVTGTRKIVGAFIKSWGASGKVNVTIPLMEETYAELTATVSIGVHSEGMKHLVHHGAGEHEEPVTLIVRLLPLSDAVKLANASPKETAVSGGRELIDELVEQLVEPPEARLAATGPPSYEFDLLEAAINTAWEKAGKKEKAGEGEHVHDELWHVHDEL